MSLDYHPTSWDWFYLYLDFAYSGLASRYTG